MAAWPLPAEIAAGRRWLVAEDLALRRWLCADASSLARAWNDTEIARRLPVPDRRDEPAALDWIEGWDARVGAGLALDLAVVDPGSDRVLGEVGLGPIERRRRAARIGWWLHADARGSAIATRAVEVVSSWALEDGGMRALVAEIDPDNQRSMNVAERAGFEMLASADDGPGATVMVRRSAATSRTGR